MAKKKARGGKKRAGKKRRASLSPAQRKEVVARRAELHKAATMLKDFHGGKLPIKSGCGRPRKK
jgi:hypothetical protein